MSSPRASDEAATEETGKTASHHSCDRTDSKAGNPVSYHSVCESRADSLPVPAPALRVTVTAEEYPEDM